MGGLLKKLFGFGNPLQKVVQTAPTSASSQGEKQEGFFTQKQQQLLVAQLQKAIMATGLPLPREGTSLYDIFCEDMYNQMADWNEGHWLGGYPCFTQDDPRFSRSDYAFAPIFCSRWIAVEERMLRFCGETQEWGTS